ncbi:MAG: hypothetical protein HGA85_07735 [Nanoarchaeota archaeon]|nr:hypothetical protein [Nanoarchaeota archaeon]
MKKKIFITGLIVISFILLVISVIFFLNNMREERQIDPAELEIMTKEQILEYVYTKQGEAHTPFFYFIPIFGFFGIVIGTLIYYIMSGDIEKKEVILKHNSGLILKLLDPEERRVVNKLVENEGKLQQLEITYMDGFTKVKAHRTIESLVNKGIMEKDKLGKTRLIRLNKELYGMLKQ